MMESKAIRGDILTDMDGFVDDGKMRLLAEGNFLLFKFNNHGILIRLFQQTMPQRVEHLERTTDDLVCFFFEQEIGRHHWIHRGGKESTTDVRR